MKKYLDILKENIQKPISIVGKHNDIPDSEFDSKELEAGIKVEMEHTDDPEIAKKIAKDHLSEPGLSDYYTRLIAMEKQAKLEKGIKDED